ncbi:hypothetical protein BKA67DRAFT_583573 [Truncatella angustata]|uniref:Uncharacterized protein n=1 Tax=Truncatella angustata TaxID=152316 RepID=A0A9P8RMN1_9PEZI|nr:uncharacterized protein BKA67DRAFT_583573 [Truncatella angustata]KAH6646215.1 hypothetical protein BKA67DRAFT_583573 [Truncatella angustata]
MPTQELVCSLCGREFRRNCHLRRHENEHSSVNYPCQFCPKRFSRRDVARRHSVTCPHRKGQNIRGQKRGRKPIACEPCSEAKLSCDHKSPCRRCSARDLKCTYRFAGNETSAVSRLDDSLITSAEPTALSFLLHVTNPAYQSVALHMGPSETISNGSYSGVSRMTTFCRPHHPCAGPDHNIMKLSEIPHKIHHGGLQRFMSSDPLCSSISKPQSVTMLEMLQTRLNFMFAEVQSTSIKSLMKYAAFFTCATYSLFIPTVSDYRQWQWSIIHWPTICLEKISYPLLLALGLGGAVLVEVQGRLNTICGLDNMFYEIVETYVFDCLETAMTFHDHSQLDTPLIEACQAALLVMAVESGIDDNATKRRLLIKRLPILVAAIRILNIAAQFHPRSPEVPTWREFLCRESCIRIVTWTFLQDALFTLICCHPPSLTTVEMICDLPCNDLLWTAKSEPDFKLVWTSQVPKMESPTLKKAIWYLIGEDSPTGVRDELGKMSVDHLFVLIWGVHSTFFNIRSSAPAWTWSTIFQRALRRWLMFWKDAVGNVERHQQLDMDYVKLAPEIAALLSRIVDIEVNGRNGALSYFQGIIHYDVNPVYELIRYISN